MVFGLLFDTLGNIISTVLNVYGSYMQIEDKSDSRQKYEYHEYHHYHRNEMPDIKKILEEKLIPDIKATTEVVRDVMNDFAQSTQQITSQIQRELIPTVKDAINVMEKESLSLSHDIKATTEVVRDVMNELAHSTQEMTTQIQQESQLISHDVKEFIPVATQVMELGLIFLLLGIAGLCRYELSKIESMPEQKWIHRLETIMVYFLRYISISYGVMRFVIVLVLKQTEPMSSWIVLLSIAPAFICMTIGVLRKVNVKQTFLFIDRQVAQCIKQITLPALLQLANIFGIMVQQSLRFIDRQIVQRIKQVLLPAILHLAIIFVTTVNVETVSLCIWVPWQFRK